MQIREENQQNVLILAPVGHLDTRSQHEFEAKILERLNGGERRFLIDMTEVEYISSSGLRVMLMLAKKLGGTEGQLVLAGMNQHVHQVFEISGLTGVFTIRKDREEALGSFSSVDPTIARVANLASRLMDVSRSDAAAAGNASHSPVSPEDASAVAEIAVNLLRLKSETAPPPPRSAAGVSQVYIPPAEAPAAPQPERAPVVAQPPAVVAAEPPRPAKRAPEPAPEPVSQPAATSEPGLIDRIVAIFRSLFRR